MLHLKKLFFASAFLLLALVFVSGDAEAIGISPASASVEYDSAGMEVEVPYIVRNNAGRDIIGRIELEGDLAEYAELSASNIPLTPGSRGSFTLYLDLPPGLDDEFVGPNDLRVIATESSPDEDEGLIVVRTSVVSRVRVHFPYPGEYLEISDFSVRAVNEGRDTSFNWEIISRGDEPTSFTARIDVFDVDDNVIISNDYSRIHLEPGERSRRTYSLETSDLSPGRYPAVLTVDYAGTSVNSSATVRIGEEDVELLSYRPEELLYNTVNQFSMRVENMWGEAFSNVYAEISLNGTTTRTPGERLPSFGTATINHYVDTSGLEPGEYDADITVFFGEHSKVFPVTFTILTEEETRALRGDEDEGTGITALHVVMALSVLVLILLIVNIIFLFKKKK